MNHIELFAIYKSICLLFYVFFFPKKKCLISSWTVSNLESWIVKMEELLSSCEKWLGIEREGIKGLGSK